MAIDFITTPYVASHGKQPSGRGSWAFSEERNPTTDQVWFSGSMTYQEAKKAAKKHFAGKTDTLFVLG